MQGHEPAPADESAFAFEGNWREYAPIAFTNLLLTIVTLGIYRFWATARTRRYLWSRSRFVDEHLEWTGTGKELLVGFLLVMALVLVPFSWPPMWRRRCCCAARRWSEASSC